MFLFQIDHKQRAFEVREKPFAKEKHLQDLCEQNLMALFSLRLVRSEFPLHRFRIDTLAYDEEANAFVIIEYKKNERFSVIDQGYAYLSLMLNNKADFILEFNETRTSNLRRNDVDWSQSRVLFVSPAFSPFQRESINFKDLPIELWEVRRYENDTVHFAQVKPAGATDSIRTISKQDDEIQKVSRDVKVYTEEDHLERSSEDITELYQALKEAVLGMGPTVEMNPTKLYLGFRANKRSITDMHLQKNGIKLWINLRAGELDDPAGVARDVSEVGHWGNGDYEIRIKDDLKLDYVVGLIRQSYRHHTSGT